MKNAINWFEIHVKDFDRQKYFMKIFSAQTYS